MRKLCVFGTRLRDAESSPTPHAHVDPICRSLSFSRACELMRDPDATPSKLARGPTLSTAMEIRPCSACCSTRQTACGQSPSDHPRRGQSSPPWALSAPPPRASSAPLRLRSESRSCPRSRERLLRCCCCRRRPKRGPGPIATCRCFEQFESRSERDELGRPCDDCCCCCGGDGDDFELEAERRRTKCRRDLDPGPVPPPSPHPPPRLSRQIGSIPTESSSAKRRGPAPCAETELSPRRGERGRTSWPRELGHAES